MRRSSALASGPGSVPTPGMVSTPRDYPPYWYRSASAGRLLDTAVTVGSNGIVRQLAVTWGTWTYAVAYSTLGEGAAVRAPANAIPMREWRRLGRLTR